MASHILFPVMGEKRRTHRSFEYLRTFGGGRQDTIHTSGSETEVYTHFVTDILRIGQSNI